MIPHYTCKTIAEAAERIREMGEGRDAYSFDIDGAHGVGLKCIGVLEGGYGDENEFKTAGAEWIVDTLADVKDIILK